jgi:hypothetical protein
MQATYILRCLEKGQTEQEIIKDFEGDAQLVEIWTNFLRDIHWVQRREMSTTPPPLANGISTWVVTDEGKERLSNTAATVDLLANARGR